MAFVVGYNLRQTSQFCFGLKLFALCFPVWLDIPALAQGCQRSSSSGVLHVYRCLVPTLVYTEVQADINSELLVPAVTMLNAALQLQQSHLCTTDIVT